MMCCGGGGNSPEEMRWRLSQVGAAKPQKNPYEWLAQRSADFFDNGLEPVEVLVSSTFGLENHVVDGKIWLASGQASIRKAGYGGEVHWHFGKDVWHTDSYMTFTCAQPSCGASRFVRPLIVRDVVDSFGEGGWHPTIADEVQDALNAYFDSLCPTSLISTSSTD